MSSRISVCIGPQQHLKFSEQHAVDQGIDASCPTPRGRLNTRHSTPSSAHESEIDMSKASKGMQHGRTPTTTTRSDR